MSAFINIRRKLIAMREEYGADTPVGRRLSNWIEQGENLDGAGEYQRGNLIPLIEKSMYEVKAMTVNAEE